MNIKSKTMSVQQANKLRQIFNLMFRCFKKKKIPFLSDRRIKSMPVKEELQERTYDPAMFVSDKVLAYFSTNYTKTVKDI